MSPTQSTPEPLSSLALSGPKVEPKIVHGDGPLDCKIAFIGEAPGADEEEQGRPFVGRAGSIATSMLHKAGIIRSQCYITNALKIRPPDNYIKPYLDLSKKVPIESPTFREHREMLVAEMEQCSANVFVLFGAVPLWAVMRMKGITKHRGSIYLSPQGRKVIPTFHPASILPRKGQVGAGNYLNAYAIAADLEKVVRESESPDVPPDTNSYWIDPTFDEVMVYLDGVEKMGEGMLVAVDIEVNRTNHEMTCIGFGFGITHICIPLLKGYRNHWHPTQEEAIWKKISLILANPKIRKVFHNASFDASHLYNKLGTVTKGIEDTFIAHGVTYPALPHGLDYVTSIYTNMPYYKEDGKQWFKFGGTTETNFWLYNAKDCAATVESLPPLLTDTQELGNEEVYRDRVRLLYPIIYMQERGMKVDVEGMRQASAAIEREIEELIRQFHTICGREINPASPKQLMQYFYIEQGERPYRKRGGGMTTDEKALKGLAMRGREEAQILLKIRNLSKLKSTYMDMKLDPDNRLRCSFNPVGAKFGRLSSSQTLRGTGGNMQNLDYRFQGFIYADEGHLLISMDLKNAENRVVAYIAPEHAMIRAFEEGKDIHRYTASLIYNLPYDDVSDVKGSSPVGSGQYSQRDIGKKTGHAANYGESLKGFSWHNEIPQKEAKYPFTRYHQVYPGIQGNYHKWVRAQVHSNRTLTTPMGRRILILGGLDKAHQADTYKAAYSAIPQATVADVINNWGLVYIYEHQDLFYPVDLLNQVHDSIIFQIDLGYGLPAIAECIEGIAASLSQPMEWKGRTFSIPVETNIGVCMGKNRMVELSPSKPYLSALEDAWEEVKSKEAI